MRLNPAPAFSLLLALFPILGQLAVLDQLAAEHGQRVGDLSDLVAAIEALERTIELAARQAIHRLDHLHQRRRQSPAKPQRRGHHDRDRDADRPEHEAPHLGELGLDGLVALAGGVSHGVQVRPQPVVDLREILGFLDQRALPGHEGEETGLVGIDQLDDLGFCLRGQIRFLELGEEFARALFQLLAVFLLTAQHEILFVAAHHQHQHRKPRLIEGLELALDRMHGGAQLPLQAVVFVVAHHLLGRDHVGETRGVVADHGTEGQRLPERVAFGQRARDTLDFAEMADCRFDRLLVRGHLLLGRLLHELGRGFAALKQPFGQSGGMGFKQAEALGDPGAVVLDPQAHQVDRADDDDARNSKQQDLRAKAKMNVVKQRMPGENLQTHDPSNQHGSKPAQARGTW